MKKILLSLLIIAGAGSALTIGSTGAFFADTEASTNNTLTAGAIDLKIDNESYYNGNKCAQVTSGVFQWQGPNPFPIPGSPCSTSWELADLNKGQLFFNFTDLKPDDEGEDTISLHVNNNPAYACLNIVLTSNDDNSTVQPELNAGDTPDDPNNTWDGELAQNINMFWWADDGDNVYETGENSISGGVTNLMDLASTTGAFQAPLADSNFNAWGAAGPIPANTTKYIGKAWCFGTLSLAPIAQDGIGHTASSTNGPQVRGTGVICDGTLLNNITQTDGTTLDVAFTTVQARHNEKFVCNGSNRPVATIKVIKIVNNIHGGNNIVPDFHLFVDNGIVATPVTSGFASQVVPGTYSVSETGVSGYVASFSGDCDIDGNVTLAAGDNKTCTITNTDLPANITLIKNVTGIAPLADPSTFRMRVDGTLVPNTTSIAVTSNSNHLISEDPKVGYHFVSITGAGCPASTSTPIVLNEGQAVTCTITNAKN